jgi:site-specific recombinase XerC
LPVLTATKRLWRQAHLTYDPPHYVAKEGRRALAIERPTPRTRVVARLARAEERQLSAHGDRVPGLRGPLITTRFQAGARVSELGHSSADAVCFAEQMALLSNAKGGKSRDVPTLLRLAQGLRTHLGPRTTGSLFETVRHTRYSPRRIQPLLQETAAEAGRPARG